MIDPQIFRPGTPAVIDFGERFSEKHTTVFRGFKNKHYLIVDQPFQNGRPVPVGDEASCVLRFISEGHIIGFRTRVIAVLRKPCPLLFLHFPKEVESSLLRRSQRYPVQLEAVLAGRRLDGRLDSYPRDTVLNLSSGGCLVQAYEPREKESIAYLTIFLPEQGPVNDLEVEVKRVERIGDKFKIGLAFADILDPNYETIRSYIHLLEAYQVRA